MRVLVTGAAGWIGRHTFAALAAAGHDVIAAVRGPVPDLMSPRTVAVGDIAAQPDWGPALEGAQAVVHLAARVHVMNEGAADPLGPFRRVNVDATRRLAAAARRAGVRRFVLMSSLKAMAEASEHPLTEADPPAPVDPYGISKLEAEQALAAEAFGEMTWCALRPPLVHGPGAGGNFARLVALVARGLPLPFSGVANRRSLIGIANLVDAIVRCVTDPRAQGPFVVRDGEDVSTPELIRKLARAMGREARLIAVPPALLRAGLAALGHGDMAARLLDSLAVDDRRFRATVDWVPPCSLDGGLRAAVDAIVAAANRNQAAHP